MPSIPILELIERESIEQVNILSLAPNLYTMRAVIDGVSYVVKEKGVAIRRPNAEVLRNMLSKVQVGKILLLHNSAYDEMVGQEVGTGNSLQVPLRPAAED